MGESDIMSSKKTTEIDSDICMSNQFISENCSQTVMFQDSSRSSENILKPDRRNIFRDNLIGVSLNPIDENMKITVNAIDNCATLKDMKKQHNTSTLMLSPSRKEENEIDEEDDSSSDDEWNKSPRVGNEYQVDSIPPVCGQCPDYDVGTDELLWDPKKIENSKVESYLTMVNEIINPSSLGPTHYIRDNEDALLVLRQCDNDVAEALRRVRFRPPPHTTELSVWSKEECRQFEHGLTLYGKDFHTIHHNKVKTKSVGEIVKFYYVWKKSSQQVKTRLGKKKEASQSTNYMEKLLDEVGPSRFSGHNDFHKLPTITSNSPLSNRSLMQSPFAEYLGLNELAEGDDVLEHIVPTLPVDADLSPETFSELDPVIFVAYSDPGQFSPIASTTTQSDVDVLATPANVVSLSSSHRCDANSRVPCLSLDGSRSRTSSSCDSLSTSTLPQDVLSSIDELESTYCASSDSDCNLPQSNLLSTMSSDSDSCSSYQVTSSSEDTIQSEAIVTNRSSCAEAAKHPHRSHLQKQITSSSNHNSSQSASRIVEVTSNLVC